MQVPTNLREESSKFVACKKLYKQVGEQAMEVMKL